MFGSGLLLFLDTNAKIIISLFWCIVYMLKFSCSARGANLGNFLSGVGAVGLLVLGALGFNKWRKEYAAKKLSDIAEKSLEILNIFNEKFLNQLSLAIIDSAHLDDQDLNKYAYYEVIKKLALLVNFKEFKNAKNKIKRLKHNSINKKLKELSDIVDYFSMIDILFFTKSLSIKNFKFKKLVEIMTQFKEKIAEIEEELNKISFFVGKLKV